MNPIHNMKPMKPLSDYFKTDSAYWGENGEWLVAYAVTRDSDALERSNFECFTKALGGESDTVAIERAGHWACGWIDQLVVNPADTERVAIAESILERLDDYPVVDESHYSETEQTEANEVWQHCYRVRERIKYIREHRSQFEFRDFQDLIGCVRGKYFAGYASKLIN